MNKYGKSLVDYASRLDSAVGACGEITGLAVNIVEDNSRNATAELLQKLTNITKNFKDDEVLRTVQRVNLSIISYYGYNTLQNLFSGDAQATDDKRSLEDLLQELDGLVGLKEVKKKVNDLIAYQSIQQIRRKNGLHSAKGTMHLAFTGNPGTGKTTVARIIGHIYKCLGLLSKGHFTEVSRTDLIAGYQGQTALKVKKVIDSARGGVLFIDEAYSITENEHSDSYGRECLTELTKALEDYRDDLVVIVAGYTKPMEVFFASNPGLKSRFNTFIEFPDYDSDELLHILTSICTANDYRVDDAALMAIKSYLDETVDSKTDNFANGRMARNLYDDLVMNHARRVYKISEPTKDDLTNIILSDFEEVIEKK